MQEKSRSWINFNPLLLAVSLVIVLRYCEDKILPDSHDSLESTRRDYVIPYHRTTSKAPVTLEPEISPEVNPESDLSDEERLGRINNILKEMGHKPVGQSQEPNNPKDENKEPGTPDRANQQAPDRRTTRRLDSLGYVINEPNSRRDRYCLTEAGCPPTENPSEEVIIIEIPEDQSYSEEY